MNYPPPFKCARASSVGVIFENAIRSFQTFISIKELPSLRMVLRIFPKSAWVGGSTLS